MMAMLTLRIWEPRGITVFPGFDLRISHSHSIMHSYLGWILPFLPAKNSRDSYGPDISWYGWSHEVPHKQNKTKKKKKADNFVRNLFRSYTNKHESHLFSLIVYQYAGTYWIDFIVEQNEMHNFSQFDHHYWARWTSYSEDNALMNGFRNWGPALDLFF